MRTHHALLPAVIAAALAAAPAHAEPTVRLELIDRGDAVEIIARDAQAARLQLAAVRSRLEVPLVGAPIAPRVTPADPTVVLMELDGQGATRVLSVKLGLPRPDVKTLAGAARAIQVGPDLHVLIPRRVPAAGAAVQLPTPTPRADAPAAAARVAPTGPTSAPAPSSATATAPAPTSAPAPAATGPAAPAEILVGPPPNPNPAPVAEPRPASAASAPAPALGPPRPPATAGPAPSSPSTPAAPLSAARPEPARPLTLAPEPGDSGSLSTLLALGGLASLGAGAWLLRRRRPGAAPSSTIEIVAQRSLGGKARIVWLTAGTRELIVSVTGQEVRTLDQWRRADPGGAAAGLAAALAGPDPRTAEPRAVGGEPRTAADSPLSPAVSGILRLRRTSQFAVAEEVATGDTAADEVWAKEILAATGARR